MPVVDGRVRDRLGRPVPQRLSALTFARAIPGWLERFSLIPDSSCDIAAREVHCTCGCHPQVEPDEHFCRCQCGRFFLFDGKHFHVANSPVRNAART